MTFKRMNIVRMIAASAWLATCLSLPSHASDIDSQVSRRPVVTSGWQPSAGDEIRFRVLRQGNPFGSHSVSFESGPDDSLVARTRVELRAGLGPVALFRYDLLASEIWKDGQLVSVEGELRVDGNRQSMRAARVGDALAVEGSGFRGEAPGDIIPASHWNYAQMKGNTILSTEDGELIGVNILPQGRETVMAGGRPVEANRYRMDSDIDVDLWYDDEGRWIKLAFQARGQRIEYILDQPY